MASLFFKPVYIRPGPFQMSIMLKNHWMPVFAWLWLCVFCATVPATGGAVDLSGSPYIVDS